MLFDHTVLLAEAGKVWGFKSLLKFQCKLIKSTTLFILYAENGTRPIENYVGLEIITKKRFVTRNCIKLGF
jgi:hypothetical protein